MVTTSQVEPRQNSVKCSSSAASTRSPFRYVPFAESRSHSRTMSCVTPTAQCKAETCGSSISMSAPPPARPMLVLAWVSWYTRGLEGPPFVTVIVIVMFLGAHRSMSEGNAPKGTEAIGPKDGNYGTKVPTVHEQQAVYHAGRLRSKDHPLFSRPHLNSTTIRVRLRNTGDTAALELFAAGEAHTQGESSTSSTWKIIRPQPGITWLPLWIQNRTFPAERLKKRRVGMFTAVENP